MLDGFMISTLSTKNYPQKKQMHLKTFMGALTYTEHAVQKHEHHFFRTSRPVFIDVS